MVFNFATAQNAKAAVSKFTGSVVTPGHLNRSTVKKVGLRLDNDEVLSVRAGRLKPLTVNVPRRSDRGPTLQH